VGGGWVVGMKPIFQKLKHAENGRKGAAREEIACLIYVQSPNELHLSKDTKDE